MADMRALAVLAPFALLIAGSSSVAAATDAGRLATAPARPQAAAGPLSPLTQADEESSHEVGCNFFFGVARHDYIQLIGDELMIRTGAKLHPCRIPNADAFMDTKGADAVCDGISLSLRSTGRVSQYPASDSAGGPARLSIVQGGVSRVVRGHWSVAC